MSSSVLLCLVIGALKHTSLLEHHSVSQRSQTHQRSPHRIRDKCLHAHPSLETTARVSPPRHWEVSIGWHTHQDMAIWLAHPREGADSFSLVLLSPFVTETWIQKMAKICSQRWYRESFRACVMPRQATAFLENYSQPSHGNTAINDNSRKFTNVAAMIFAPAGARHIVSMYERTQVCMNTSMLVFTFACRCMVASLRCIRGISTNVLVHLPFRTLVRFTLLTRVGPPRSPLTSTCDKHAVPPPSQLRTHRNALSVSPHSTPIVHSAFL